jgi:predicted ATP-binding protein involved in virulence
MRINQIDLTNFRNFEQATFHFPSLFTVVIGENGKGKSTLLQGLRVAAGTILVGFKETKHTQIQIQPEDIRRIELEKRFVPQFSCMVRARGSLGPFYISWTRSKGNLQSPTLSIKSRLTNLARHLDNEINTELKENIDLPVLAYFSTARLWSEQKKDVPLKTKGSKIQDGYAGCLDVHSDKFIAFSWIKSNYYKSLKGQDDSLLKAVLEAISQCVPNWTAMEWDEDSDDLLGIYRHDNGSETRMPLYYLSDGLRTMASIAAEIAYRCVILNDHHGVDAVKKSAGIVLIDELDMHLHPNWQRHVVSDLKTAFPNIQFVATTHSPFIVQSLDSSELINLDTPTDIQPKDLSVEEVSEAIMGVDSSYSIESQQTEDLSTDYFRKLETLGQSPQNQSALFDELDQLESNVSDPAMRALLQMKRLEKTVKH